MFLIGRHRGVRRITWPASHQISQQLLRDCIMKDIHTPTSVWFVSSEPGDGYLPSESIQNGDLLESISQGEQEMVETRKEYGGGDLIMGPPFS